MSEDRALGLAVCVASLLFMLFAVPTISDDWMRQAGAQYFTIGPRLMPYLSGGLCLLLGALVAWTARPAATAVPKPDARRWTAPAVVALTLAYAALVAPLGFITSSALMLVVFMLIFGVRHPLVLAAVAIALPIAIEAVFRHFLILELPSGPFPPLF